MFFQKKPKVKQVKKVAYSEAWRSSGIICQVEKGKGLLQNAYGEIDNRGLQTLLLGEMPLIRFHGDNYMYPTCEKLISAGYGRDKATGRLMEELRGALNGPFVSLEQSLEDLSPLLALLPSGFYGLADIELYPTDGNGNFFWTVTNTPAENPATCPIYEDGNWFGEQPLFALPSQPPTHYNPERAEYYRDKPESRAVAYNTGFLNILLDGHHKGAAAALEGRKLKTLVVFPMTGLLHPCESNQYKAKLGIGGEWVPLDDLGITFEEVKKLNFSKRLSEKETKNYLADREKGFDGYIWPQVFTDAARRYPTAYVLACMEWTEDLSDARLDRILRGEELPDDIGMKSLCTVLHFMENPRFCELAFWAGEAFCYRCIWADIFLLLSNICSEAVEAFFIRYLVYDEGIRPAATAIANDYLAGET